MVEEKQTHAKEKMEEKKTETKVEAKQEEKKTESKKIEKKKKTEVSVQGLSLAMSPKAGKHICDMIRAKDVDKAIKMLEEVTQFKRAVAMNNREIGHRHGMAAGRYPQNASNEFIRLLKQLKASALYHELELEKSRIVECYINVASKPYKRGGARFKRTHVYIKLAMKKEKQTENKQMEKKK